jgi:8-oxo-dGTP pyrophosphatase MutT (NUDIX family)
VIPAGLHRVLLRVFRVLPGALRSGIVRIASPTFTAGAAVVLVDEAGQILLVTQTYTDGWGLPGGLMSGAEEPGDTARREIREELGIDTGHLAAPPIVIKSRGRRHLNMIYVVDVTPDVAAQARPESVEIGEVGWFPPTRLPALAEDMDLSLAAAGFIPPADAAR